MGFPAYRPRRMRANPAVRAFNRAIWYTRCS